MTPGPRKFKSASCRVAIPEGLPDEMRDGIREVLEVHSENPRKGHAKGLLGALCSEADGLGVVLMLRVDQYDDGPDNSQLQRLYAGFGFLVIQDEPLLMARNVCGATAEEMNGKLATVQH